MINNVVLPYLVLGVGQRHFHTVYCIVISTALQWLRKCIFLWEQVTLLSWQINRRKTIKHDLVSTVYYKLDWVHKKLHFHLHTSNSQKHLFQKKSNSLVTSHFYLHIWIQWIFSRGIRFPRAFIISLKLFKQYQNMLYFYIHYFYGSHFTLNFKHLSKTD